MYTKSLVKLGKNPWRNLSFERVLTELGHSRNRVLTEVDRGTDKKETARSGAISYFF